MGKGSLYEGGIRIPFIVSGPGIGREGVSNQPIAVEDLFSTILEWTGIQNATIEQKVDGASIDRFIRNTSLVDDNKILLWHYPNNWTNINLHGISWASAMRKGKWKLIYFHKDGNLELYDVVDDIGETNDLSLVYPDQLKMMARLMSDELKKRGAKLPTRKQNGEVIPWPDAVAKSR
jgi:arylsulfatase A-like enzyme